MAYQATKGPSADQFSTQRHIAQRVTAIALIPLAIWLVATVIRLLQAPIDKTAEFIASPVNMVGIVMLTIWGMIHGLLGIRMVIEDYVTCRAWRIGLLLGLYFICAVTAISAIIATFTLHIFFILRIPG